MKPTAGRSCIARQASIAAWLAAPGKPRNASRLATRTSDDNANTTANPRACAPTAVSTAPPSSAPLTVATAWATL